jgi:hypothetical protein
MNDEHAVRLVDCVVKEEHGTTWHSKQLLAAIEKKPPRIEDTFFTLVYQPMPAHFSKP